VTGGADGKVDYNKLVAQVRAITSSPARRRAAVVRGSDVDVGDRSLLTGAACDPRSSAARC
jgi:hypothetical protein